MMKNKSKALIIFFTLLLVLSMASTVVLREDGFAPPIPSPSSTQEKERSRKGDGDGVECKSSDSEEECLVKKTVAAHTDYIYTQDLNLSP